MAETSIQWCDFTFNGWEGCEKVSPGCKHCYAEARDRRFHDGAHWGPKAPRVRTSPSNWKKPLAWDRAAVQANVAADLAGKPRPPRPRVFCASLADVFEDRPELVGWRTALFDLIMKTPSLDWLLLTKRPQNIKPAIEDAIDVVNAGASNADLRLWLGLWRDGEPPPNVWLGTTVEDQQRANERIPALLEVPAVVRFLSCEPLLERVDLTRWLDQPWAVIGDDGRPRAAPTRARPDWVIIGGESGPGARPFHLEWARNLVRQCRAAGVAPFVKQLGACASDPVNGIAGRSLQVHPDAQALISRRLVDPAGGDMAEWPYDLRVREFPEVHRG